MIDENPKKEVIELENKVIAMARIMYPGISCFTARHLDPIRKQLKDAEANMRVEPFKAPIPKIPAPQEVEPKHLPKRKYSKRKK
jgi:hypothetical protein